MISLNEIKTEGRCRLYGDNPIIFVLNVLNLRCLKLTGRDDHWGVTGTCGTQE